MLELKSVSYEVFDEGKNIDIVNNIDLEVPDGEFLVITGPNGGGKSTLVKLIMGLIKPTSGTILFNGQNITNLSVTDRAHLGIGYAFQHPARFKGLTVHKLLSIAHGGDLPEDECCAYLTRVGLCSKDYLHREIDSSLSGGEIKRIEIATLMARELKLAIYDEPEAGIDLWSFSMLVEGFKDIRKGKKETVIIISHQERIMRIADRIAVVSAGRLSDDGPVNEIFPKLIDKLGNACDFRQKPEEQ
ncbi:MAG: Methionine import ATP-binding protein MetN [Firmicutes bacterium ADurb.Bin300]|nr:MAG: Methionine import ATP-binding protein MetN [Firmicutes bacterium ADurb.Bin300]